MLNHINTFVFDVDGVMTDGSLQVSTDGQLLRTMHVKDGYALKKAIRKGYTICVISGGKNEGVRRRLRNLGITDIYLGVENKVDKLDEFFDIYEINPDKVVYMGDDIPDTHPMKLIGLPSCPQNAVPEVKSLSRYISHKNGGEGCVRDIIEQVLKVQHNWESPQEH